MPKYSVLYRSPDTQGVIRSEQTGPSEGIVRQNLIAQGFTVLLIQASNKGTWSERLGERFKKDLQMPRFGVNMDELTLLCEIFKALYSSGVQMLQIVELTIEETPNPWLRKKLAIVLEHLKVGDSLADSMSDARCKKAFPPLMVETIRTGEANGRLDEALGRLKDTFKRLADTRRETMSALAYPMFTFGVFLVVCLLLAIIIPRALNEFVGKENLDKFRDSLPLAIRILFFFHDHPVWLIAPPSFIVSMVVGWNIGMKRRATRHALTWVRRHTPLIGKLTKQFALVRLLELLMANHESGIAIGESLRLTRNSVDEAFLENSLDRVRENIVKNGVSLGDAINDEQERYLYPGLVRQMIRAGEASGRFSEMLTPIRTYYMEQSRALLKRIIDLITPAMIVSLGLVVGPVVVGIYQTIQMLTEAMVNGFGG